MAEPKMHKVPGKDELQKLDLVPTAKEILKAGNHIYDMLNDQGAPEKFRNDFYEAFGQIGYCDEHNNVKWEVQEGLRKLNRVLGQTYNGKLL